MTRTGMTSALEGAGYFNVRLYPNKKWAAIRRYASGFAIASGDEKFVHNELWWFKAYSTAIKSLDAWETGLHSPPNVGGVGPRQMIAHKGTLKEWNSKVRK